MSENTDSTKLKVTMVGAVVIIVIIAMFSFIVINRQGSGALTIKIGENEATMEIAENKDNFIALMEELMKEENKTNTLAILRANYGLYVKDDPDLVDKIRERPGMDDFSLKLREVLFDLKGPFKRDLHTYHDIEICEVIDAIEKLPYEHDVPKEFRERSDNREGIFKQLPIDVKVMISNSDNISDGEAVVYVEEGDFSERECLLYYGDNPDSYLSALTVLVVSQLPKHPYQGKKPCFMITPNDGKMFIGESANSGERYNAVAYKYKKGVGGRPSRKPEPIVDASTRESSKKRASIEQHEVAF